MTSLAVIFILLLVVFANASRSAEALPEPPKNSASAKTLLQDHFRQYGLTLESDPHDPFGLNIAIPESLLRFEFGQSILTPSADRFLADLMPVYAAAVCGPLRDQIAAVIIEGHTDDLGGDVLNLRLSQERSFRVMVRGLEVIQATVPSDYRCFEQLTSASGRGKQDLIYAADHLPNRDLSRRVIFKILLRSPERTG
jgi:outer membrane protein OmpA-like peptidoglycan-associated protein